jgi:lipase chaperone LimK
MPSLKKASAVSLCAVLTAAILASLVSASQDQPASNMDILRDKIKADKKLLIAENLGLTEAESKVFWPVYEEYQKELEALNGRLGKVIQGYANEYNANTLTDDKARTLMTEALSIEEAEVALKKKCLDKLNGIIPAIKAARYLQMENKIRALIRFDLAANIPLAP